MAVVDWRGDGWRLEDHRGRPVVLLFHRDFACTPCKAHAIDVRDRLDEFGDALVVVVLDTRPRNLRGYRARFVAPLDVITDETRALHESFHFGMGADGVPVGGDVIVGRDGAVVLRYAADSPARPSVDDLVAAVRSAS
ncbi:MAG TPA: redoxin domain-containing protein [Acidimicrobiales bacterium]|nr:redoxin domain-containing protein [Acidimicrobiales bacterium]